MSNTIHCHDRVNQPYPRVRDALIAGPLHVFRRATAAAATGTAKLVVPLGPIDVSADVAVRVIQVETDQDFDEPATRWTLVWSARRRPELFPQMTATIAISALGPTETQLELEGHYTAPLGKLGEAVTHKVVQVSVQHFLAEVADWLREELAYSVGVGAAV
jgi:hypothetical protein